MSRAWFPGLFAALLVFGSGSALAAPADSTGMDWSRVPEYRIVPGDVLRFNFGPPPTTPNDIIREGRVRPDGRVSVFPVGDVIAAGRTVRELQIAVVELMAAEYRFPRVAIEIFESAGNRVHVLGRVKAPGSYVALPFMTVSQAIAAANGFEDDASRNSVLVYHRDGASTIRVERIQLERAMKRADLDADPLLSRFDIVFVPRSSIGNLEVFTRQLFGSTGIVLQSAIAGWELFNLDRVFVIR
ncbi:MAG: polysaccharide biosynthesis/export family protein [Candidatus Eisenbacteria bacterium]